MTMNSEPLHTFEEIVRRSFGPVCKKFGLTHVRSLIYGPECSTTFENSVAGVTVHLEMGAGVWVQVGQLHRDKSDKVVRREFYDLSFFLDERAPMEKRSPRFDDVNDPALSGVVDELARQVSAYAADVLEGDFAVLPRIRERAEENLRVTEARLYGR
jgi:hypothetical protein